MRALIISLFTFISSFAFADCYADLRYEGTFNPRDITWFCGQRPTDDQIFVAINLRLMTYQSSDAVTAALSDEGPSRQAVTSARQLMLQQQVHRDDALFAGMLNPELSDFGCVVSRMRGQRGLARSAAQACFNDRQMAQELRRQQEIARQQEAARREQLRQQEVRRQQELARLEDLRRQQELARQQQPQVPQVYQPAVVTYPAGGQSGLDYIDGYTTGYEQYQEPEVPMTGPTGRVGILDLPN